MNGDPASAIRESASAALAPFTPAGSAAGPTTTKSLCITVRRSPALPAAINSSSAAGECASTTSASPRSPISIASPLPTAIVLTG